MFQSLFYWILFFYNFYSNPSVDYFLCFNPYSTGFSSFIYNGPSYKWYKDEFQSLFYWILFFYKEPNYLGEEGDIFVSILILLDSLLLYSEHSIGRRIYEVFQSLFYWILFFYISGINRSGKFNIRFNPYSTGFSSFIKV